MTDATSAHVPSIDLLTKMLFGVAEMSRSYDPNDAADPDFNLSKIDVEGSEITTTLTLPSGDRFRVTVEWLTEETP